MGESNGAPEITTAERRAMLRSIVVASRILLLLLAVGAVMAAAAITVRDRPRGESHERYACPMHPEVRAPEPGECPICRMALEPVRLPAATSTTDRARPGAADMAAVENVRKHNIIDFVRKRSLLLNERELRGPAWVESDGMITAVFYSDQIDSLVADERGAFSLTQAPRITFAVRRTADPVVRWDRSMSRFRFRLDTDRAPGPTPALKPGQVGWLELAPRPRQVLTVPASAVLQSPEGPYVLASAGSFGFEKRPIEIGETFLKQGFVVVLSGVRVNERVVARAAFFLDADRRLRGEAGEGAWGTP